MGPFDWLIPFWGQHQKLDSEWIDWMIIDLNSKIKYIVFPWRWYSTAFIASIPPHWDKNWGQRGREICHRLLKRFILDLVFLSVLLNKWVCYMGALRYTCYFNHFFMYCCCEYKCCYLLWNFIWILQFFWMVILWIKYSYFTWLILCCYSGGGYERPQKEKEGENTSAEKQCVCCERLNGRGW